MGKKHSFMSFVTWKQNYFVNACKLNDSLMTVKMFNLFKMLSKQFEIGLFTVQL